MYVWKYVKEPIYYSTEFHGHKTNLLNDTRMSQLLSWLNWVYQRIIMFIYNTIQLPNPQNLEKMCIWNGDSSNEVHLSYIRGNERHSNEKEDEKTWTSYRIFMKFQRKLLTHNTFLCIK